MEETELFYVQLDKYAIEENLIMQENSVVCDEGVPVELFNYAEVQKPLSSYSNVRSWSINGVTYEDIKNNWEEYGEDIVRLFNIILRKKNFRYRGNMPLFNGSPRKPSIEMICWHLQTFHFYQIYVKCSRLVFVIEK